MNQANKRLGLLYQLFFLLVSAGLLSISFMTFRSLENSASHAMWVEHTHEVSLKTEKVFSFLKDAESGVRGYNLGGVVSYLDSYQSSLDSVKKLLFNLQKLTIDNASQQKRIQKIEKIIAERIDIFNENILLYNQQKYTVLNE